MENPLVSVIIPTKNSSRYIGECLESLKRQTYSNLEVIVVDDYSIDETVKIARQYNVNVVIRKTTKSQAKNFGIKISKGEYIFDLDSNTILPPTIIEDCLKAIKDFDAVVISETGSGGNFWANCKRLERRLYIGNPNIETPAFIRRSIFNGKEGFDVDIDSLDDWSLNAFLISRKAKITRIATLNIVNEYDFKIKKAVIGKFRRGRDFAIFKKKYPHEAYKRTSLRIRLPSYIKNPRILEKPLLFFGLLTLKLAEYICFKFGTFYGPLIRDRDWKAIQKENIVNLFNEEAGTYEESMYKKSLGAQYIDEIEKDTVMKIFSRETLSPENCVLLDLGIGPGRWSREFLKLGMNVLGSDISFNMCEKARENLNFEKRFKVLTADMQILPYKEGSFDFINNIRAFKYVQDYQSCLKEMYRVLKHKGKLILEVPNLSIFVFLPYFMAHIVRRITSRIKIMNYLSLITIFRRKKIERSLLKANFQIKKIIPLFVIPATVYIKADTNFRLNFLKKIENIFFRILPQDWIARSFVILAEKKELVLYA